jgi:hypothetical protein
MDGNLCGSVRGRVLFRGAVRGTDTCGGMPNELEGEPSLGVVDGAFVRGVLHVVDDIGNQACGSAAWAIADHPTRTQRESNKSTRIGMLATITNPFGPSA